VSLEDWAGILENRAVLFIEENLITVIAKLSNGEEWVDKVREYVALADR
jgi:hypothetical protein